MTQIIFQHKNMIYRDKIKTFFVKGSAVQFDTSYQVINNDSKKSMQFDFHESTGSEWDPNTLWIYKSKDAQYTLVVGNDDVTPAHAQKYLEAKLRNARCYRPSYELADGTVIVVTEDWITGMAGESMTILRFQTLQGDPIDYLNIRDSLEDSDRDEIDQRLSQIAELNYQTALNWIR